MPERDPSAEEVAALLNGYILAFLAKRGGELRDHSFPAPLLRRRGGPPHETTGTTVSGDPGARSDAPRRGGAGRYHRWHPGARRPRRHRTSRRDPRWWGHRLRLRFISR